MLKLFAYIIILSVFIVSFNNCANRVAPSGGPEDKTPPVVISALPGNDSLFVNRNRSITFTFSEWVRTENIEKSVFISPTEPLMKVKAYGRNIELVPKGPLMDSTTYVVVLGSDIQDMRGNKLAESFSLTFSTGAFLDSCRINGMVSDEQGRAISAGLSIFAYLIKDTVSVNPVKDIPDYITQSGNDGFFHFKGLKFGKYRLFAVNDFNRNRRFNPDRETIGMPAFDAVLSYKNTSADGFVFFPMKQDTLPLFLEKVQLKPGGQLFITFNKTVPDSLRLNPANFTIAILDSNIKKNKTIPISAIYPYPGDSLTQLCKIEPEAGFRKYRCRATSLTSTSGAHLDTSKAYVDFIGSLGTDSIAPYVVDFYPLRNSIDISEADSMVLRFSEPIRMDDLISGFSLFRIEISKKKIDTLFKSDTAYFPVKGQGAFFTPLKFVFKPDSSLVPEAHYGWKLDPKKFIDESGNFSTDTLLKGGFSVIAEGEYGSITGQVKDSISNCRIRLLSRTGRMIVEKSPDTKGLYRLDHVPEGDYRILAYWDANGNRRFDEGVLSPFSFAEKAVIAFDSLHVRKRWEVEQMDILPIGVKK